MKGSISPEELKKRMGDGTQPHKGSISPEMFRSISQKKQDTLGQYGADVLGEDYIATPGKTTAGEAVAAYGAQGLTSGWSDEALAKGKSLYKGTPYEEELSKEREYLKTLEKEHPTASQLADIGGSLAQSTLAAPIRGATLAAKGAYTLAPVVAEAYGRSEKKTLGDVAPAIGLGIAGQGAGELVSRAPGLAKEGSVRFAETMLNTPRELLDRYSKFYRKSPELLENALTDAELSKKVQTGIGDVKSKLIEGSKESKDILEKNPRLFGRKSLVDDIDNIEREFVNTHSKLNTPDTKATKSLLQNFRDALSKENQGYSVKPLEIKKMLIDLDSASKYDTGAGTILSADEVVTSKVRKLLDNRLKEVLPEKEYKNVMEDVSDSAELLSGLKKLGKTEESSFGKISRALRKGEGSVAGENVGELLRRVDEKTGSKLLQEFEANHLKKAMDTSVVNGSMNVQKFSNLFKGGGLVAAGAFGIKDPGIGAVVAGTALSMGAILGASVDKYGRQMTKKSIDMYQNAVDAYNSKSPAALKKSVNYIRDQAAKGVPQAVVAKQMVDAVLPTTNED